MINIYHHLETMLVREMMGWHDTIDGMRTPSFTRTTVVSRQGISYPMDMIYSINTAVEGRHVKTRWHDAKD